MKSNSKKTLVIVILVVALALALILALTNNNAKNAAIEEKDYYLSLAEEVVALQPVLPPAHPHPGASADTG